MKSRAFTLIELLVVVLIIGILSAVALPQYTKAVKKSRATEAKINLSALVRASDVYVLTDPTYDGGDMSVLDIQIQNSEHWHYVNNECVHEGGHHGCSWEAHNQDDPIVITAYSKEYHLANGTQNGPTFACVEDEEGFCSQYGFTKYDESGLWYLE